MGSRDGSLRQPDEVARHERHLVCGLRQVDARGLVAGIRVERGLLGLAHESREGRRAAAEDAHPRERRRQHLHEVQRRELEGVAAGVERIPQRRQDGPTCGLGALGGVAGLGRILVVREDPAVGRHVRLMAPAGLRPLRDLHDPGRNAVGLALRVERGDLIGRRRGGDGCRQRYQRDKGVQERAKTRRPTSCRCPWSPHPAAPSMHRAARGVQREPRAGRSGIRSGTSGPSSRPTVRVDAKLRASAGELGRPT